MSLKQLGHLSEVDEDGAKRPIHHITSITRISLPHFHHPLGPQQTKGLEQKNEYSIKAILDKVKGKQAFDEQI